MIVTRVIHGSGPDKDRADWEVGEEDGDKMLISLAIDFNVVMGMAILEAVWGDEIGNEEVDTFYLSLDQLFVQV